MVAPAADSVDALAVALVSQAGAGDREALEDVLAVFVLSLPTAQRDLDDDGIALLGRFALRAGLAGDESAEDAQVIIVRYLESHPLRTELLQAAARVAREQLGTGGAVAEHLRKFTGDARNSGVLGGGERPQGSTPAGPLARFLVQKKP